MTLNPAGVPSRGDIQAAIDEAKNLAIAASDIDSHTGTYWGAAFVPGTHRHKTHSVMASVTPNASGNVILISNLTTLFAGVSAVVATPGNSASTVFQVATSLVTNAINANLRNSAGAAVTSGVQTVSVIVHGWA